MGELNAKLRSAVTATMGDHARQRYLAVVRVKPKATMFARAGPGSTE